MPEGHKGRYHGCLGELLLDAKEQQIVLGCRGDMGEHGRDVLQDKFRLLCGKLKSWVSMVALSEILPIPQVRLERWAKICSLSAWTRRHSQSDVGFGSSGTSGRTSGDRKNL